VLIAIAAVVIISSVAVGVTVDPNQGSTFVPLTTPSRLLDSRIGNGLSGPFRPGVPRTFQVTGRGGVPAGATAVTGNLTVRAATAAGYVFLGANPVASPTSSTLNFPKGDDRVNGVTVALSATGTLSATYRNSGTTHLTFDVTGYFIPAPSGAPGPTGEPGPTGPPGTDGVSGYEVVSQTATLGNTSNRSDWTVNCPDGKVPLSGGWRDEFFAGGGSFAAAGEMGPISSYPTATGWSFIYWDPGTIIHDVTFFVVCAAVAP
jgi:hypothetical protein